MTDTPSLTGSPSPSPATTPATDPPKPQRKWPRALLAGFLSLPFPGAGQLLNRQPRKTVLLALPIYVLDLLFVKTRLPFAFWPLVFCCLLAVALRIFVVAEAAYSAATGKSPEAPVPLPALTYSVLAIALSVPRIIPYPDVKKDIGFAAFRISSASMCPTFCTGERIIADSRAYQSHPPQRGDLILLQHPSSLALFPKRVIGLPGDTVSPGPNGTILVSGQPFVPPPPCAQSVDKKGPSAYPQRINPDDYADFHSTVVPPDTYFVVGDNIGNSFDSRIPDFGPVTADMLRGNPLYIYWSPNLHRIGCQLR